MEFAPDGRLFVATQKGEVRVIQDGALLPAPFLTVNTFRRGESGLDGLTLDPHFEQNGYVYVDYTVSGPAHHNRVSRFTASPTNPNVATPGSERVLLDDIPNPTDSHVSGALHCAANGMLYVSVGDGTKKGRAQRLGSLLGKVLRIDPAAYPNVIPRGNPFVHRRGARPEIWAVGFRNPFTFAVTPRGNALYVNDVGNHAWESLDRVTRGGNYRWPICEGRCASPMPGLTDPIYQYRHLNGPRATGNAITGGAFSAGLRFPARYRRGYFFADFVAGFIRYLKPGSQQAQPFARGIPSPIDLDVGPDGRLYYLSRAVGEIDALGFDGRVPRRHLGGGGPRRHRRR
jgi:glucose/arabinose dehydrogenase